MSDIQLNNRVQRILTNLVEHYIHDGQPVGSKTLASDPAVSVSSATIRNILVELEQAGFVSSPHTSAGRVPTERGYRFFVDSLLQTQLSSDIDLGELKQQIASESGSQDLVGSVSSLLSSMTRLAGVVTLPKREHMVLRHLEFLPLSNKRVLVILVFNETEVQNRIIHTEREYSASELQESANFILEHFAGRPLADVRQHLYQALEQDRQDLDLWMQNALAMANSALSEDASDDCVIAGESNLLNVASTEGVEQLQTLFNAFNRKQSVLHLLDRCLGADGVQIFIGQESGFSEFEDFSVVTAPYSAGGDVLGMLGVIGPTRMDYQQVISTVEVTAKLLSAALRDD